MIPASAFIAAILTDPDDDSPRLVFADWLDEQDQFDRAEFIRVQCELAKGQPRNAIGRIQGYGPRADRWVSLLNCEWKLLATHDRSWAAGIPADAEYSFARGFVDAITCTGAVWLHYADAILAAQPVRQVTLTTRSLLPLNTLYLEGGEMKSDRWPGVKFHLPQYGPSPLQGAFDAFEAGERSMAEIIRSSLNRNTTRGFGGRTVGMPTADQP